MIVTTQLNYRWRTYDRVFSDGKQEKRYIREIVFGKRRSVQYWQVTTDIETLPENSTWYLMSKIPGVKYKDIGNLYGSYIPHFTL